MSERPKESESAIESEIEECKTSLVLEPDQESNGDDHVVERKTSQSPKVVPKGEF